MTRLYRMLAGYLRRGAQARRLVGQTVEIHPGLCEPHDQFAFVISARGKHATVRTLVDGHVHTIPVTHITALAGCGRKG